MPILLDRPFNPLPAKYTSELTVTETVAMLREQVERLNEKLENLKMYELMAITSDTEMVRGGSSHTFETEFPKITDREVVGIVGVEFDEDYDYISLTNFYVDYDRDVAVCNMFNNSNEDITTRVRMVLLYVARKVE